MPIYTFNITHPHIYAHIHSYMPIHTCIHMHCTHIHTHTHIHACSYTQSSTMRHLCTPQTSPKLGQETKKTQKTKQPFWASEGVPWRWEAAPHFSLRILCHHQGRWARHVADEQPHSVEPPVFTAPIPTPCPGLPCSAMSVELAERWCCRGSGTRVFRGNRLAGQGLWILFWVQWEPLRTSCMRNCYLSPYPAPWPWPSVSGELSSKRIEFLGDRKVWAAGTCLSLPSASTGLHGPTAPRIPGTQRSWPLSLPPTVGRGFHHLPQHPGPLERGVSCSIMSNSCDPMDCSPPGSSVHGILQARILEWVAISFSREFSRPRDRIWISCIAGGFFTMSQF